MVIRFKFRSSVAFDSIDIGSRPSISVRELRSKIADRKKLQICGDFDLVLSDADTGQAFEDEDFQIRENAAVVIKRVPRGRETCHDKVVIPDAAGKSGGAVSITRSETLGIHNFDDFGVDVYPNVEAPIHCYADDVNQFNPNFNQEGAAIRFSEVPNLRDQNIEKGHLSGASSKEVAAVSCRREFYKGVNPKEMNSPNNGHLKYKLCEDTPFPGILNADLPAELRCSLCNTIFEDAVMIPCCQHSFCNKCIALALAKRSSCPKCSSTKCTVKDLLPNLSLRQAIEHFLEAQNAVNVSYNNLPRYAPDGESGIQAKDLSYAVSVQQQEQAACPHSPSATGMGSSHVISDPASESGRVVIPPIKYRKYERNCYMCGSPDHLIRECPYSKRGNAMVSGGLPPYREGYWHGASFSNVPYANIYGAPPMLSFDPMMFRVTPFGMSSCLPPMYSNPPTPYGFMGMGTAPPLMMSGVEAGVYAGSVNNQVGEGRHNNELQDRYHGSGLSEDYFSGGTRRSHEQLNHPDKETSSDNDEQWAHKKSLHHKPHQKPNQADKRFLVDVKHKEHHILACQRDDRRNYSEKSKSDLLDISDGSRRHSGERKSSHYRSSKHSGSDSSYKSHHISRISDDDEFATYPKKHSYKHRNYSGSSSVFEFSAGHRKFYREQESSHSSRPSSKIDKSRDAPLVDDTRERSRQGLHYHKCRRIR